MRQKRSRTSSWIIGTVMTAGIVLAGGLYKIGTHEPVTVRAPDIRELHEQKPLIPEPKYTWAEYTINNSGRLKDVARVTGEDLDSLMAWNPAITEKKLMTSGEVVRYKVR